MYIEAQDIAEAYLRVLHISDYHILMILIIVDIVSGLVKGIVTKRLDSAVGIKGLAKHTAVITVIFLLTPYLSIIGFEWAGRILIYSFVSIYGISIVENYAAMGLPLPNFIAQFFRRLNEETKTINLDTTKNLCEVTINQEDRIEKKDKIIKDQREGISRNESNRVNK